MKPIKRKTERRKRRCLRIRKKVAGTNGTPRLTVFRSLRNISCQLVDDSLGKTLSSASTFSREIRDQVSSAGNKEAAELVGKMIAAEAAKLGITKVVFDRRGYKYHGRVKSLAEGARSSGLIF